ncbi:MAG: hypothetical protein IJD79_02020 [Clostridia bacterium]|nr:hypothetical protein [Clostridia bacterium]
MLYGDGKHDDTEDLQSMLDECGIVMLLKPGIYLVSRTLIIHSNTRFVLSPGAHLLAAPYSKCALIENEHFRGEGRDCNIEIIGGIFDGNCDNMGLDGEYEAIHRLDDPYSPDLFKGKLMRFAHVDNIALEKLTVKDPVSYGIQIADAVGFVTRDIHFDYNWHFGTTDGVHINGPACDGVIENLHGTTNDDMVSLTTIDESHAEVTAGEISNVYIHNVSAHNGYSGVRLLAVGNYDLKNVTVSGVYGDFRHNAVLVSHHKMRPDTRIWFDNIIIEHIHASKSCTPLGDGCFRYWERECYRGPIIWFESGVHVGSAVIRDVTRHEESTVTCGYLVQLDKNATFDRLTVENVYQTNAEGVNAPVWYNEATVREYIERDVNKTAMKQSKA